MECCHVLGFASIRVHASAFKDNASVTVDRALLDPERDPADPNGTLIVRLACRSVK